ncbi:MAG: response regulator transcription factor [Clostridia bacterium]|nr:response regulator transcription factor [Clostridia bacterium]
MEPVIRVFVVDDHPLVREGITKILGLEESFQIVGEADSGGEALRLIVENRPDIILLDLKLPDMTGIEVCREIKKLYPEGKVIALTIYDDEAHVIESVRAGVVGYLPKDVDPDTLIEAVKYAAQGKTYFHPSIAGKIINETLCQGFNPCRISRKRLTSREIEVLSLVARGYTNKDIAEELYISEKTVKNHMTNIFRKLEVNDRTEAVVYAMRAGLI